MPLSLRNLFINSLLVLTLPGLAACSKQQDKQHAGNEEMQRFRTLLTYEDQNVRELKADRFWQDLQESGQIPVTSDSVAVFLYRGEAESVSWNGDFNNWSGDKSFDNAGTRIPGTDLWYLETTFPDDARLDYKITLDGSDWILDPANPHRQWSGFGPNSELRMPEWKAEALTERLEQAPQGTLSDYRIIDSEEMGYRIQYRVYTPAGSSDSDTLPIAYFTDGQEYAADRLGAATVMLDNLIHLGEIEPVRAVFTEPLNPDDPSENRRADEFGMNESYLRFYTEELIPEVENRYTTPGNAENRAIIGTSLGGLNATFFGFSRPDLFGHLGIQAPAFWYRPDIYSLVEQYDKQSGPLTIYMSVGTIGDNIDDARKMLELFREHDLNVKYTEVPEGHSWGAWRAQMDDMLKQFFKH